MWNELTFLWSDLTIDWNVLTVNLRSHIKSLIRNVL